MKLIMIALITLVSLQSFAFTIECFSENNLDVSQLDFKSLIITSTPKGNWITINGQTTKLGETLPIRLNPLLRDTVQAESFTVLNPLKFGAFTFNTGSALSYGYNKKETEAYKNTIISILDFARRVQVDMDCEFKK